MQSSFTLNVPYTIKPIKLIENILNKRETLLNIKGERPCDYVLKVCGQEEYLIGDYELIEFQYVQDSIARDIMPVLITMAVHRVPSK